MITAEWPAKLKASEALRDNEPSHWVVHCDAWGGPTVADCGSEAHSEKFARLFAAAPDYKLIAWAFTNGARFEPIGTDGNCEIDFAGLSYETSLDSDGIPKLTKALRAHLHSVIQRTKGLT